MLQSLSAKDNSTCENTCTIIFPAQFLLTLQLRSVDGDGGSSSRYPMGHSNTGRQKR